MIYLNQENMDFPLPDYDFCNKEGYIIYGTGEVAASYYQKLCQLVGEDCIPYFLDSSHSKESFYKKQVLHPSEIPEKEKNSCYFILASFTNTISMQAELMRYGVKPEQIIKSLRYTFDSFTKQKSEWNRICLYPKTSPEIWENLMSKINYYVPILKETSIVIDNGCQMEAEAYDLILVWDKQYLYHDRIGRNKAVYCIDPTFFQFIDIKILVYWNYMLHRKNLFHYQQVSISHLEKLRKTIGTTAFIFGTGPSLSEGISKISKIDTDAPLYITCNGGIYSKKLMNEIKPNLYAISDIGALTKEYQDMTNRIVDYIESSNCILTLCEWWIPFFCVHYPQISHRLLGLSEQASSIHFPDESEMSIYGKAHNVITRFAIPMASALCNTIYITGCDGVEITNKKESMSFPHDSSIGNTGQNTCQRQDYFLQHYNYFEELLEYGESQGKTYYSVTNSFIPALSKRILTQAGRISK